MERREYLKRLGFVGVMGGMAGCSDGSDTPTSTITPVPVTPTLTPGGTETETETFRTPTIDVRTPTDSPEPTPTRTPRYTDDTIDAVTSPFESRSIHHFLQYGLTNVSLRVYPKELVNEYPDGYKVGVIMFSYPNFDESYSMGESEVVEEYERPFDIEFSISNRFKPDDVVFYSAFVYDEEHDINFITRAARDEIEEIAISDPFTTENRSAVPVKREAELDIVEEKGFERLVADGRYVLTFNGTTDGSDWKFWYAQYKHSYEQELLKERMSRKEMVAYSLRTGDPSSLAGLLDKVAESVGVTSQIGKVEFVMDFVQGLPYVSDEVGAGFDDRPKYFNEVLGEGRGDCEDASMFLAAVVNSAPFSLDVVLLEFENHIAVGVKGSGVDGKYYEYDGERYYYVESTGSGWSFGEIPEQYDGEEPNIIDLDGSG